MNMLTIVNSNIKGYHFFKRQPRPLVEMVVKEEITNPYDADAMVVVMPSLDDIHPSLYDEITHASKGWNDPEQTVRTNAGKIIGRVPANIGKIFNQLLKEGDVKKVTCWSVEDPKLSKIPPPEQSFKRNPVGYDRRGGGAIIKCKYQLHCKPNRYYKVRDVIESSLKALEFQGTEKLEEKQESCPL